MRFSNKTSRISSVVAAICISIYIAAIIFGAVQVYIKLDERRTTAEREFNDLMDRAAASSVFLGFLSDSFRESIRDFLFSSETLTGIIITGTSGQYAVEREIGSSIIWNGSSPRFKTGVLFSGGPISLPLRVEGQRSVSVQAVFSYYDYDFFQTVLRNSLFAILIALIVALITLMIELIVRNKSGYDSINAASVTVDDGFPYGDFDISGSDSEMEHNIIQKLSQEIRRCASLEQDLVLLSAELKSPQFVSESLFQRFNDEAVSFFSMRDLVFEKNENAIFIIIPGINLEEGLSKSEDFCNLIVSRFSESHMYEEPILCIGLSSRSGRLVEAERLLTEANTALEKALSDPDSNIIGFKSDLEKYRRFIKSKSV